jgi:hypothetical protein
VTGSGLRRTSSELYFQLWSRTYFLIYTKTLPNKAKVDPSHLRPSILREAYRSIEAFAALSLHAACGIRQGTMKFDRCARDLSNDQDRDEVATASGRL